MPASMTGFGRSETREEKWTCTWEVRSVNGRFLDLKWRLPSAVRSMENAWEKVVRDYAGRGRVDLSLNLEVTAPELLNVRFNQAQASAMVAEMNRFASSLEQTFLPDFNRLLTVSHLWRESDSEADPELLAGLERGLRAALEDWKQSRVDEGADLKVDMLERIQRLQGYADKVREYVPGVLEEKKRNLRERIEKLLADVGVEYPEERMLQEVAVLTDKLDVSEELTRLDSHLARLTEVLSGGGECGKKLDFLVQETFREINTCGNKAQNTDVSKLVVDFKAELEKIREQVQNLE